MRAKKEAALRELLRELTDERKELVLRKEEVEERIVDKEVEIGEVKRMMH
jgi:hypothetical protein